MNRITRKDLDGAVNLLNRITGNEAEPYRGEHGKWFGRITGNEAEPYRGEHGKWFANIGNFHISGAYGGVSLHQMVNENGGVRDVFQCGHIPMRDLYNLIHAFRNGIEYSREKTEVTA